jgi:nucleoside 2-deoxyribosyltransferase
MNYAVYLAGPITGLAYEAATDWRENVITSLPEHIKGLSPMRGKQYLGNEAYIKDSYSEHVMSTTKAIVTRDRFDATRCDVLLVNLVGATKVSIGTVMEIAWADAARIPIVVAMEKGNVHEHGMLVQVSGYVVETLEEAVSIVKHILTP